jgi:cardiolipin synthase A/B
MIFAENIVDGHRVFPILLRDLDSATRVIDVAMFLFFDDPIGEEIARILATKARAGVAVRVLLNVEKTNRADPFGTGEKEMMKKDPRFHRDPTDVTAMRKQLVEAGVEVLDTEIDYSEIPETGEPDLPTIAGEIKETVVVDAFHVDHRKIVTVDGRIAYCGSANFGAQYQYHRPFDPTKGAKEEADAARDAGEPEPWWKWHDGLVRFEGSIVRDLDKVFRERWRLGGGADFVPVETELGASPRGVRVRSARILKNEPSSRPNEIRATFVERIIAAERTIFIENPFLYHPTIVETLLAAKKARPALRVTLIVPARGCNPNKFTQDAQQYHYAAYLDAGIDVFEYQNHFNHLKLATFDQRWAIVGSANLNFRSMEDDKDFEACVLIDSDEFARGIDRDVRDEDVRWSKRVTADDVQGTSLHALRTRMRDPRTLMLIAAREL